MQKHYAHHSRTGFLRPSWKSGEMRLWNMVRVAPSMHDMHEWAKHRARFDLQENGLMRPLGSQHVQHLMLFPRPFGCGRSRPKRKEGQLIVRQL